MGYVAFDWDGTIQKLGADEPTPLVPYVKWLLDEGVEVRIITARVNSKETAQHIRAHTDHIRERCLRWLGRELPVSAEKDYDMLVLYDDRTVAVEPNTGLILGGQVACPGGKPHPTYGPFFKAAVDVYTGGIAAKSESAGE